MSCWRWKQYELVDGRAAAEQLGDLGAKQESEKRGFIVHSVLLSAAESGCTVGLIEQERWCGPVTERGKRRRRGERAYGEKESFKWQRASGRMAERLGVTQARVKSVCDREADVYEYLQYKVERGERFVVRASSELRVAGEARRLFEALERAPVLGSHGVRVQQRGGAHARRSRQAHLQVRSACIEFCAPRRAPGLPSLRVNAVSAMEAHRPAWAGTLVLAVVGERTGGYHHRGAAGIEPLCAALASGGFSQGVEIRRWGRSPTYAVGRQFGAHGRDIGIHRGAAAAIARMAR